MEPMQKFWMLKVENGGSPTAVHTTWESAEGRAHALARGTRSRVAILEVVAVVTPQLPAPEETTTKITRIPGVK